MSDSLSLPLFPVEGAPSAAGALEPGCTHRVRAGPGDDHCAGAGGSDVTVDIPEVEITG